MFGLIYSADIFWRNRACLLTRSSVRCLSGIRLSFAIVLTSRTCVHICGLPAGSLEKKLLNSTAVLVLRINKLINRSAWSECTRAEKKGRVYVAHVCLNGTSQIILEHARCSPAEKTKLNADALMLSRLHFNKGKVQYHTRESDDAIKQRCIESIKTLVR